MFKLRDACVLLFLALPAAAQAQAFETISIKLAASNHPRDTRLRVEPNGDVSASSVHPATLLAYAYDLPMNPTERFSSRAPDTREKYDIEAKAPANAIPANLPEREKRGRMKAMMRGLLADRFKLVIRSEQKTMPVYVLTVASGGPKLQKSTIAEKDCVFDMSLAPSSLDSCHTFVMGRGHPLTGAAVDMDDLSLYMEQWTDLPVVNRTALNGLFAVQTEGWQPLQLPPPPPGAGPRPSVDDLPTLFTVLGKLGLELKKQEAAVPVYTLDHIEPPAGVARQ
jgi:uncharacterized protein (TIGR03435 family)